MVVKRDECILLPQNQTYVIPTTEEIYQIEPIALPNQTRWCVSCRKRYVLDLLVDIKTVKRRIGAIKYNTKTYLPYYAHLTRHRGKDAWGLNLRSQ